MRQSFRMGRQFARGQLGFCCGIENPGRYGQLRAQTPSRREQRAPRANPASLRDFRRSGRPRRALPAFEAAFRGPLPVWCVALPDFRSGSPDCLRQVSRAASNSNPAVFSRARHSFVSDDAADARTRPAKGIEAGAPVGDARLGGRDGAAAAAMAPRRRSVAAMSASHREKETASTADARTETADGSCFASRLPFCLLDNAQIQKGAAARSSGSDN